jgi:signal transduction histidine kinase
MDSPESSIDGSGGVLSSADQERMVSVVAHDLKNAIGNVLLGLEMIERRKAASGDPMLDVLLRDITGSAKNTHFLLETMLEWMRYRMADHLQHRVMLSLKPFLRAITESLNAELERKDIHIELDMNEHYTVSADADLLASVLRNLILNAIRYSPRDSVIKIWIQSAGAFLEIHIRDASAGIAPDERVRLFSVEDSVERRGTEGERGYGIGLVLCRELIALMGGFLGYNELNEESSEFFIRLKLGL